MKICEDFPKLLFDHSINNWQYFNDDNEVSVVLISPSKLKIKNTAVYKSWENGKELTIVGVLCRDFEVIIKDIENFVIRNMRYVDDHAALIAAMYQLKHGSKRTNYQCSEVGEKRLQKILGHGFEVDSKWIRWPHYIPIHAIIFRNHIYNVDPDELKSLGYGVTSFRVLNDKTLKSGVYCKGKHPNLSLGSKKFCCEAGTAGFEVDLDNLVIITGFLSHINMNHPYQPYCHIEKLKHLYN